MPDVEIDTNGNLADDRQCIGCTYNLRGLDAEGACPECGVAIGRSLRGDLLQYSNPRWVERIARSMNVALVALLVGFVFFVPFSAVWHEKYTSDLDQWIFAAIIVGIPALIGLYASWMFSTAEYNAPAPETSPNWRLIARWSAVVLVALVAMEGPIELIGLNFWREVIAIGIAVASVSVFAAGRYAASLARRLNDYNLARQTLFVSMGCTLVGLSATFGMTYFAIDPTIANVSLLPNFSATMPAWLQVILILGAGVISLGFVIFGLATVALMLRYRGALRKAAHQARRTWAKDVKRENLSSS